MSEKRHLSVPEVAARWGVARKTVRRRIESGKLEAIDVGTPQRSLFRIPLAAVEAYERRQKLGGATPPG